MTGAAETGVLIINGVETGTITTTTDEAASRAAVVAEINKISSQTGVVAIDTNDVDKGVQLMAADGRNITLLQKNGGTLDSANTGLSAVIDTPASATPTTGEKDIATFTASITLNSASEFTIAKGTNGDAKLIDSLGMGAGTYGAGRSGQSLDTIDLSTQEGASAALKAIDNALSTVDSARADQGAVQNRFDSVLSSLASSSTNLTDARSRIQDADFAAETANLSKAQVLQQAGVAMLAQANQLPQGVLSLLR